MTIIKPTDASIILTYRCPMRCKMCNIWDNPTIKEKELKPSELECLPQLKFINLTGGEPFVREDIDEIVEVCYKKSPRIVISTSGWFEIALLTWLRNFQRLASALALRDYSRRMTN